MDIENRIFPYVKSESGALADLREIDLEERSEHLKDVLEDERTCQLCKLQPVEEADDETLRKVNGGSTKEPVICKACFHSMETQTNSLTNLVEVKTEISDTRDDNAIEGLSSIKCEEIEIKSEENSNDSWTLNGEPVNCTNECEPEYLRTNNPADESKRKPHDLKEKYNDLKHKNKIYKCDFCNYTSSQKRNFIRHRQMHEKIPDEEMFKCDSCDYKTRRKEHLARHELRHKDISEKQMYRCNLCGYMTDQKRYLKRHVLTHKEVHKEGCIIVISERMYNCDLCNYKSKRKDYLVHHQLRHNNSSEKLLHQCNLCNYITNQKSNFTRHVRKHKEIPKG